MKMVLVALAAMVLPVPGLAEPAAPGAASNAAIQTMFTADGQGVVIAVDSKTATVTIHHSPIPALNWPAMTMSFKASPPSILQGIKPGQAVTSKLMQMGGSTTLTAIQSK